MTNRLADATSPYLQQHAHNPVEWWPWCEEALDTARRENKPILLSIGYSACHWCHVMAHESFEDEETAAVMNALFVRCPPWRAKRRRVVPGSREATRDTRRAEGAKGDPKGASERGVQSYGRPV
ncbi:MAG: hypothetical protein DSZ00_09450, partial [Gammaproteobacteria bacterium]